MDFRLGLLWTVLYSGVIETDERCMEEAVG